MKKKNKTLERLKVFYLLALVMAAVIIAPTHIFPQPYFMYARFPHYLEMMPKFLGLSWPVTFELYHQILYLLAIIISTNAIGIICYPRFKKLTSYFSLMGIFAFLLITLFFFLKFIYVNTSTAVVFGLYSLIMLFLNILIFEVVITKKKRA